MATGTTGPTALRRELGRRLRELRIAAGLIVGDVAGALEISASTISRIETAETRPKTPVLVGLLGHYQVDDATRDALMALHRESGKPGWWHLYRGDLPPWFPRLLDLEETATAITTYEPQLVPGLLQTDAYATAVLTAGPDTTPDAVARRTEVRLRRQDVLNRDDPPGLWVIVEEPVLLRPVGSPATLREQLRHLAALADRPRITIQVVPLSAGVHPALGSSAFTLLQFAAEQPPLVYVEESEGAAYHERPGSVRHFQTRLDHLRAVALPPRDSRELISRLGKDQP